MPVARSESRSRAEAVSVRLTAASGWAVERDALVITAHSMQHTGVFQWQLVKIKPARVAQPALPWGLGPDTETASGLGPPGRPQRVRAVRLAVGCLPAGGSSSAGTVLLASFVEPALS